MAQSVFLCPLHLHLQLLGCLVGFVWWVVACWFRRFSFLSSSRRFVRLASGVLSSFVVLGTSRPWCMVRAVCLDSFRGCVRLSRCGAPWAAAASVPASSSFWSLFSEVGVKTPSSNCVTTMFFCSEFVCFAYQGLPGGSRVGRARHRSDPPRGNDDGAETETETKETRETTNIPTPTTPQAPAPMEDISRSGHLNPLNLM